MHFREDKTKSVLFANKQKIKSIRNLNVKYKDIKRKYWQVSYLGCVLNETFSGEPMALKQLNKINGKLKFFYDKNKKHQHYALHSSSHILNMSALHGTLALM